MAPGFLFNKNSLHKGHAQYFHFTAPIVSKGKNTHPLPVFACLTEHLFIDLTCQRSGSGLIS